MDQFNLEKELTQLKGANSAAMEMSPLVRSRLDETYALIADMPVQPASKPRWSRLRRTATATAAAAVLGAGLFASGFVSPVMADSIKSIPLLGSLFSSIEADIGLRNAGDLGLATSVNRQVSHEDVKLEVTETVFDGSRAAFLLHVEAPNLSEGSYDTGKKTVKLSDAIQQVTVSIDGKRQGDAGSLLLGTNYFAAGKAQPNMLIVEEVLDNSGNGTLPDSFHAEVTITLDGIDHAFQLSVPFHKSTDHIASLQPNAVAADDELTFTYTDLQATPLTTRIRYSVALNGQDALKKKDEMKLNAIRVAVFDDQGRQLPALNGDGEFEANRLTFDSRYASTPGTARYLILKPFLVKDDFSETVQDDQFIKGLETRIDLPASSR